MEGGARLAADRGLAQLVGRRRPSRPRNVASRRATRRRGAAAPRHRRRSPPSRCVGPRRRGCARRRPSTRPRPAAGRPAAGSRAGDVARFRRCQRAVPVRGRAAAAAAGSRRCSATGGARCRRSGRSARRARPSGAPRRGAGMRMAVEQGGQDARPTECQEAPADRADGFHRSAFALVRGLDVLGTMMPRPAFEGAAPSWNGVAVHRAPGMRTRGDRWRPSRSTTSRSGMATSSPRSRT